MANDDLGNQYHVFTLFICHWRIVSSFLFIYLFVCLLCYLKIHKDKNVNSVDMKTVQNIYPV